MYFLENHSTSASRPSDTLSIKIIVPKSAGIKRKEYATNRSIK